MKQLTAGLSAVVLFSAPTTPLAAAAGLTHEQLTQQCRPQAEAIIPGSISSLENEIAEWQQALRETPELKERGEPIIRDDQQQIASLRADGVQGAAMRTMMDPYRQAGSSSKAEIRQALREARTATGPDAALAACLLEAVLADLEGRPLKAANTAGTRPAAVQPPRPTIASQAPPAAGLASTDSNPGMFRVDPVPLSCAKYELLPGIEPGGRRYYQVRNTCNYAIEIWTKTIIDGQWNNSYDLTGDISPYATKKSYGILAKGFHVTIMAVCPAKASLEARLGKKLTGVYTQNGKLVGCWSMLENTGVGVAR